MQKQNWIIILIVSGLFLLIFSEIIDAVNAPKKEIPELKQDTWIAPSLFLDRELKGEERQLIIYGEELIANTAKYLGPNGSVAAITNGMNCQNCHLNAGRKSWAIIMVLLQPIIQSSAIEVEQSKQYIKE